MDPKQIENYFSFLNAEERIQDYIAIGYCYMYFVN